MLGGHDKTFVLAERLGLLENTLLGQTQGRRSLSFQPLSRRYSRETRSKSFQFEKSFGPQVRPKFRLPVNS